VPTIELMADHTLIEKVDAVEAIAAASKMGRLIKHPLRYIYAILHRELIYRVTQQEKEVVSTTFFGVDMHLFLPSSTDIYLTGGKSHLSETRLAKYLIRELRAGDTFVDVGAHYGYFSLLASQLVGNKGKVLSFEASPTTYQILSKNAAKASNVTCLNRAVSDVNTELTFYEFPNQYSEYNTSEVEQFANESWYQKHKPKAIQIETVVLDEYLPSSDISPSIIKIDVEGAEDKVITGLQQLLVSNTPTIIMEYLSEDRGNVQHQAAEQILKTAGYSAFEIDSEGRPKIIETVPKHLQSKGLDSDNIVFRKGANHM